MHDKLRHFSEEMGKLYDERFFPPHTRKAILIAWLEMESRALVQAAADLEPRRLETQKDVLVQAVRVALMAMRLADLAVDLSKPQG